MQKIIFCSQTVETLPHLFPQHNYFYAVPQCCIFLFVLVCLPLITIYDAEWRAHTLFLNEYHKHYTVVTSLLTTPCKTSWTEYSHKTRDHQHLPLSIFRDGSVSLDFIPTSFQVVKSATYFFGATTYSILFNTRVYVRYISRTVTTFVSLWKSDLCVRLPTHKLTNLHRHPPKTHVRCSTLVLLPHPGSTLTTGNCKNGRVGWTRTPLTYSYHEALSLCTSQPSVTVTWALYSNQGWNCSTNYACDAYSPSSPAPSPTPSMPLASLPITLSFPPAPLSLHATHFHGTTWLMAAFALIGRCQNSLVSAVKLFVKNWVDIKVVLLSKFYYVEEK